MSQDGTQAFLDRYGSPYTFHELFESTRQLISDVFHEYTLIGFNWNLRNEDDPVDAMVGKIWLRFDKRVIGSPAERLADSPFNYASVGWGGYSTMAGPWHKLGLKLTELNHGVPVQQQMQIETYAYAFEFNRAIFPNILQSDIMHKIAGKGREEAAVRTWTRPGQHSIDDQQLAKLGIIRTQMALREIK